MYAHKGAPPGIQCDISSQEIDKAKFDAFCEANGFIGWFPTSAKENINIGSHPAIVSHHLFLVSYSPPSFLFIFIIIAGGRGFADKAMNMLIEAILAIPTDGSADAPPPEDLIRIDGQSGRPVASKDRPCCE